MFASGSDAVETVIVGAGGAAATPGFTETTNASSDGLLNGQLGCLS